MIGQLEEMTKCRHRVPFQLDHIFRLQEFNYTPPQICTFTTRIPIPKHKGEGKENCKYEEG